MPFHKGSGFLIETKDIRKKIENEYEMRSLDDEEMSLNSGNSSIQEYQPILSKRGSKELAGSKLTQDKGLRDF
jgi:hypothetical protein